MSTIKVLGIDLGKSSFHAIGRDYSDNQVIRKKFSRSALLTYLHHLPPCIIAFCYQLASQRPISIQSRGYAEARVTYKKKSGKVSAFSEHTSIAFIRTCSNHLANT